MTARSSKISLVAGAFALLLAVALPAQAQKTYAFPKTKPVVAMTSPAGWVEKVFDDDYVEVATKGEEIFVDLWIFDKATTLEEAGKAAGTEVGKYIKDATVDKTVDTGDFNGMKCVTVSGTGKYKDGGKSIEWEIALFKPDDKTICAMLYYGEPGAYKTYKADVDAIEKSVTKK